MFELNERIVAGERIVTVAGHIGMGEVEGFRRRLFDLVGDRRAVVAIDASQIRYTYSDGLEVLVELAAKLELAGGKLRILNPSPTMRRLLAASMVDRVISVANTREAAVVGSV